MLGALLHSFNPAKQRLQRIPTLESQTEDAHTKSLLFPDALLLAQPASLSDSLPGDLPFSTASANNLTDCGAADIDLESPRDVRIIIAQNFTGQQDQAVLFDSWPATQLEASPTPSVASLAERVPRSPSTAPPTRRSSIVSHESGRRSPSSLSNSGAFQRNRHRNASLSTPLPYIDETLQARHRESEDMVKTALDCMFENAQSSYKGTSNRIHIIPLDPRPQENVLSSPTFADTPQSYSTGRGGPPRRSHLAKSYTPGEPVPGPIGADNGRIPRTPHQAHQRRRNVLISRTFSIPLLDEGETSSSNEPTPTASNPDPNATGYPFPKTSHPGMLRLLPQQGRSHSLPMYGISIVISLPVASFSGAPRRNQSGYFPPMSHGTDSMASSPGSEGRTGSWSFVESMLGVQSIMSDSFSSDVDDRVDLVGQHWDVISRALSALQYVAQYAILSLLKPQVRTFRPQLSPNALAADNGIRTVAESTTRRIVRGLKIPRVRTGQGRWGVWREEMIWLSKWTASLNQAMFLYNLVAGFLGQHTDWLKVLAPRQYRRRQREVQSQRSSDALTIPSRTIVVTDNKMAGRRLVFVLSAFLPATHSTFDTSSPARPGTAASIRGYSQSPPTGIGLVRQESLRRAINRRAQTSSSRTRQQFARGSRSGFNAGPSEDRSGSAQVDVDQGQMHEHHRRGSDARSILRVPASSVEPSASTRKSGLATTATVMPESAVPAAHFAIQRSSSTTDIASFHRQPGSNGSLASINLATALQRDPASANSASTTAGSRWGSLKSLWSSGSRYESSTDYSDMLQSTDEGLGILSSGAPKMSHTRTPSKLEQMVQEVQQMSVRDEELQGTGDQQAPDVFQNGGDDSGTSSGARPIPERARMPDSPFKMSVNEKDGIIDVQFPFPDISGSPPARSIFFSSHGSHSHHHRRDSGHRHYHSSSFNSTASNSPSHSHPPILHLQHHGSGPSDTNHPLNVAGWLALFHPDFALQSVQPYPDLLSDIKAAMSTEPTPMTAAMALDPDSGPVDLWVDVCQCLIADARSGVMRRISLRRLVRLVPILGQPAVTPGLTPGAAPLGMASRGAAERAATRHRSGHANDGYTRGRPDGGASVVVSEIHLKEEWNEEIVTNVDRVLSGVLEQVMEGQTSPVERQNTSNDSSRSNSRRGRTRGQPGDAITETYNPQGPDSTSAPGAEAPALAPNGPLVGLAPRETQKAVIGALEQIVTSVAADVRVEHGVSDAADLERKPAGADGEESALRAGIRKWMTELDEGLLQAR